MGMGEDKDKKTAVFDYNIPEEIEENKMNEDLGATDPLVSSLNRTLAHKDTLKR